jgi:cytohesin
MKNILITAFAAVVLVGCGPSVGIHEAAGSGNIEAVKQHMAANTDVNVKGMGNMTPLHGAASNGHKEVVELLIAKGADVNAQDKDYATPLDWAKRHPEIADLLRKHGGKMGEEVEPDISIHRAAVEGDIIAVKQHLDAGTDVNAKDSARCTPLHWAAWGGHKETAELLIAKGANVNVKRDNGETPLDAAISRYQTKAADLLRKHGGKTKKELEAAEPVAETSQPEPSTVKAPEANSDKEKALELLFGTNSTITEKDEAFLSAAKKGKLDEVKSLLAEGVDVDCSDAFSCTGLFWASANNHKSIVEYLIEKGANLNAGAGVGGTPLARAAYEGHVEVVELLIAKGADVNAKDVSGGSPLDSADESVVDLLRKHGAK